MTRVKRGIKGAARRKRVTKMAKGFRGARKNLYRTAREAVNKAMAKATIDRRVKKREFRRLWILRINAAVRGHGLSYSRFIDGLQKAGITVNRKMLADLAITEPESFTKLVLEARNALQAQ